MIILAILVIMKSRGNVWRGFMSKFTYFCGFIILLLACFSFLSDVITVTGYNFIHWLRNQFPESAVITALIFIIIGLVYWVKSLIKQNNKLKTKITELRRESLSKADESLLVEFSQSFNDNLFNFTEMLAQTRQMSFEQIQDIENKITLFGYPHKKFQNERLENAKRNLLHSLSSFLDFYLQHSVSTAAPSMIRFKPKSNTEEENYLTKLKEFYKCWETFMIVVKNESHDQDHISQN